MRVGRLPFGHRYTDVRPTVETPQYILEGRQQRRLVLCRRPKCLGGTWRAGNLQNTAVLNEGTYEDSWPYALLPAIDIGGDLHPAGQLWHGTDNFRHRAFHGW